MLSLLTKVFLSKWVNNILLKGLYFSNFIYFSPYETQALLVQNPEIKSTKSFTQLLTISTNKDELFTVLSTILLVLTFSVILILIRKNNDKKSKLKSLEKDELMAVLAKEKKTRAKVAHKLHEDLGQLLSTAKLYVSSIENHTGIKQIQYIDNSLAIIDKAVNEVRTVSQQLMPSTLINYGLVNALTELIEKIEFNSDLKIHFVSKSLSKRLEPNLEVDLYRISEDILQYFVKMNYAKPLTFEIAKNQKNINLIFSFSSCHIQNDEMENSDDWISINSNIKLLEGKVFIDNSTIKGQTNINIVINTQ